MNDILDMAEKLRDTAYEHQKACERAIATLDRLIELSKKNAEMFK